MLNAINLIVAERAVRQALWKRFWQGNELDHEQPRESSSERTALAESIDIAQETPDCGTSQQLGPSTATRGPCFIDSTPGVLDTSSTAQNDVDGTGVGESEDRQRESQPSQQQIADEQRLHQIQLEREQALRDPYYVTVRQEEYTDYTDGPARLIGANDGIRNCLALLLRADLSQSIKLVLDRQRLYLAHENWAENKECEIHQFQVMLLNEKRTPGAGLRSVTDRGLSNPWVEGRPKDKRNHEIDQDVMWRMGKNVDDEEREMELQLKYDAAGLRRCHLRVMKQIEEAFIRARLWEPEELDGGSPAKFYNFQDEYWKAYDQLFGPDDYLWCREPKKLHQYTDPKTEELDVILEAYYSVREEFNAADVQLTLDYDFYDQEWLDLGSKEPDGKPVQNASYDHLIGLWRKHVDSAQDALNVLEDKLREATKAVEEAGFDLFAVKCCNSRREYQRYPLNGTEGQNVIATRSEPSRRSDAPVQSKTWREGRSNSL
ncbi:uncharacterized protein RCC_04469 [Ramularia collo-cygni]|uniref:Uncharacterized protein n=1 Tax=Ramularia collo-cygni TaxID=112498 RepID=A0A2D3UWI1_9PEZI|nr:uncharacterized protein RCC_04469 [Ramularia collo-cygni]CZT18625.1 uncharacterized protein RCC_04469 [Ramularia collo-cygni]